MDCSWLAPVAVAAVCLGCGTASNGSAGDSGLDCRSSLSSKTVASATSSPSARTVTLRTIDGNAPSRGVTCVALDVTSSGAPAGGVDGLTVSVHPWMPAMGHGSSVVPQVTSIGGGRYLVEDLSLVMPGTWQLQLTLDGSSHDTATLSFDVQ